MFHAVLKQLSFDNSYYGFVALLFVVSLAGYFRYAAHKTAAHHPGQPKETTSLSESQLQTEANTEVAYWSEWLQKEYARGNWSEKTWSDFGAVPPIADVAPLTSKRFDCTTYVETVGALARSGGTKNFYPELIRIRYKDGDTSFTGRNHFPEGDWIPNNISAGSLLDVTESIANAAGLMARVEEKTLDRARWYARVQSSSRGRSLASVPAPEEWQKPQRVQLSYIAKEELDAVIPFIPEGAVLNFVKKNREDVDVLIRHQGLFVTKGPNGESGAFFRHSTTKGKIQTVPLKAYMRLQEAKDWPLLGLNVNVFTTPKK
jgi:hypothetical protein